MTNTTILILTTMAAVSAIFWLVIHSGRRGEMHQQKAAIKPSESRKQNRVG